MMNKLFVGLLKIFGVLILLSWILGMLTALLAYWPILVAILGVLLLLWLVFLYNKLVHHRNACDAAWSGIDIELKRRYDLILNLVETVRGYAAYERETLQRVVEARTRAVASTGSPASQAQDENVFVAALRQLFALVENYPQLKADQQFLKLQQELINTEDRLQAARRFYNANVRDFNNLIGAIPTNLIAGLFRFRPRDFFEVENAMERAVPRVELGRD